MKIVQFVKMGLAAAFIAAALSVSVAPDVSFAYSLNFEEIKVNYKEMESEKGRPGFNG